MAAPKKKPSAFAPTITNVLCGECGHTNEVQRVFCHNCGAKLDRSAYLAEVERIEAQEKKAGPAKIGVVSRGGFSFGSLIWTIIKITVGSFIVAALIALFTPSDFPPAPSQTDKDQGMNVGIELETALSSPAPTQVNFTEGALNAYIASRVKPKAAATSPGFWEGSFRAAAVDMEDKTFTLHTQRKFFDFVTLSYSSTLAFSTEKDNKLAMKSTGGRIGILSIPGILSTRLDAFLLAEVGDGFKSLIKQAPAKVKQVNPRKDSLNLVIAPPAP